MPPSCPFGIAERKRGGSGPRNEASHIREETLVTPENHKAIARRFFEESLQKLPGDRAASNLLLKCG